ncbi:MAG: insulinase family protein [Nitrospira sp.]|nr:insulinase family protein [Nitrospira sp.]MDH4370465.1 insulinase family protein [Nitrospira sp.]MDH5498143.1 insulinase family protein [Nitrospira sp.]MDH5724431.1 insulinase family protein [Nitrospira sp.]
MNMRSEVARLLGVVVLLLVSGSVAYSADLEAEDPRTMTFEPVEFSPPEPERVVLDNGLVVYLLEDHELPLVTITATMRTGSWLDPADKVGLAAMTGAVMRAGGGGGLSAEQVDAELDQFAGDVHIGIGRQSGSASLDVLSKDLDRGLEIFAGLIRSPAFEPARLELAKLQAIESIRRRQDSPGSIVSREFSKALYGADHPTARESSVDSIKRLTRQDLVAFHRHTIHPNGMLLGVTGDFTRDELLASLRKVFGDWQTGTVPELKIPDVSEADLSQSVIRFINKDTSQTHLRVGHLSIKESDPDYVALAIANDILGGSSFRSRLFNDVRTKRGLAYSVGSRLYTGMHDQGVWMMRAETKMTSTQEVIERFVANMERMRGEPVTDAELAEAKEAYVNSFVFSFASPSAIVSRLIELEYDGLPKDFLQQLRAQVIQLTKEDVLAAAKKHLRPDRLKIIAVGSGDALTKALSAFGDVKEIKLSPEG